MAYDAPPNANMGPAVPRVDGRLKVTGSALYAADFQLPDLAHAFLLTSAIAKGRVAAFDLEDAWETPGILDILTHESALALNEPTFFPAGGTAATTIQPLASAQIWHEGQIIAMVIADTSEAAREAAQRIRVRYDAEPPAATLESRGVETRALAEADDSHEDPAVGDAEAALAESATVVDVEYRTPTQHHNALELFSTTCAWSGEQLTIYEPSQWVYGLKHGVAQQLGIDPGNVRAISPYVGGAFGSKGSVTARTALVATAARRLGRPVRLVVTRDQGYTVTTYRAETKHRIRLGASADGALTAYSHESWELSSRPDTYVVGGTATTARLYATPHVATKVNVVHADRNTPGFMRSPPEVPYVYALESAMDELAERLNMDPVELRRRNDTRVDPITGAPYSSRPLMQCYDEAARAFGWSGRDPRPGAMREGDWFVGWGCATSVYPTHVGPAAACVRLDRRGRVTVETAAHDLGTGTYTAIAVTVAQKLGIGIDAIQVSLGDSAFPPGTIAGGSVTTASVCSAVANGCEAVREELFRAAVTANVSPLAGHDPASLNLAGGGVAAPGGPTVPVETILEQAGLEKIETTGAWVPEGLPADSVRQAANGSLVMTGGPMEQRSVFAFGAEFLEVRVHRRTGEIRVPRAVGAFAAGHIVSPVTARSQYLGGLIWGISSALHEETEIDSGAARYVNDNISEYLVPVNADIGTVDIIMVADTDESTNPVGAKGLGELANVGTAAAVGNAVYHATGRRVRKLPIRIEDLL